MNNSITCELSENTTQMAGQYLVPKPLVCHDCLQIEKLLTVIQVIGRFLRPLRLLPLLSGDCAFPFECSDARFFISSASRTENSKNNWWKCHWRWNPNSLTHQTSSHSKPHTFTYIYPATNLATLHYRSALVRWNTEAHLTLPSYHLHRRWHHCSSHSSGLSGTVILSCCAIRHS